MGILQHSQVTIHALSRPSRLSLSPRLLLLHQQLHRRRYHQCNPSFNTTITSSSSFDNPINMPQRPRKNSRPEAAAGGSSSSNNTSTSNSNTNNSRNNSNSNPQKRQFHNGPKRYSPASSHPVLASSLHSNSRDPLSSNANVPSSEFKRPLSTSSATPATPKRTSSPSASTSSSSPSSTSFVKKKVLRDFILANDYTAILESCAEAVINPNGNSLGKNDARCKKFFDTLQYEIKRHNRDPYELALNVLAGLRPPQKMPGLRQIVEGSESNNGVMTEQVRSALIRKALFGIEGQRLILKGFMSILRAPQFRQSSSSSSSASSSTVTTSTTTTTMTPSLTITHTKTFFELLHNGQATPMLLIALEVFSRHGPKHHQTHNRPLLISLSQRLLSCNAIEDAMTIIKRFDLWDSVPLNPVITTMLSTSELRPYTNALQTIPKFMTMFLGQLERTIANGLESFHRQLSRNPGGIGGSVFPHRITEQYKVHVKLATNYFVEIGRREMEMESEGGSGSGSESTELELTTQLIIERYPSILISSRLGSLNWIWSNRKKLCVELQDASIMTCQRIDDLLDEIIRGPPFAEMYAKGIIIKLLEYQEWRDASEAFARRYRLEWFLERVLQTSYHGGSGMHKVLFRSGGSRKSGSKSAETEDMDDMDENSLPRYRIPHDVPIIFIDSEPGLVDMGTYVPDMRVVAIDCEWSPCFFELRDQGAALLQIGCEMKNGDGEMSSRRLVFIIDMLKADTDVSFRKALLKILVPMLQSPRIKKLGFGFGEDLKMLENVCRGTGMLARGMQNSVDLASRDVEVVKSIQRAAGALKNSNNSRGNELKLNSLSDLAKHILGTKLDKQWRISHWGKRPLCADQLEYAAGDVVVLLDLWEMVVKSGGGK